MHKFGDEQNRLHIPIHQVNYPSPLEQWVFWSFQIVWYETLILLGRNAVWFDS